MVSDAMSVWRVLDVNANRAAEALRTLEDLARLVWEDADAARTIKTLRHGLATALQSLDREQRLSARATYRDAGTQNTTTTETSRSAYIDIVRAEAERAFQALRVLEEFSKLIDPVASGLLKQLRYESYDALAHIELRWTKHAWVRAVQLCLLVDCERPLDEFAQYLRSLCEAGLRCVQIRDKKREAHDLLQYASAAVALLQQYDGHVVVNDRADIALASGAAGVHIGQEDLPIAAVRKIAGQRLAIGVSTHSIEQARRAVQDGADYIGCGPSFPSQTKSFDQFAGVEYLRQVALEISIPSWAIGGIEAANLKQVLDSGIQAVALSGAIHRASDPAAAMQLMYKALSEHARPATPLLSSTAGGLG